MAIDVNKVIAWESGEMNDRQTVEFFSELVKDGDCWKLQGMYGRAAMFFIEQGILDKSGKILIDLDKL